VSDLEIPHEVGDFAILVQSGFTKYQAILSQLFTALGAFLGTIIGIAIQHFSASGDDTGALVEGIFGTSVTVGDLVLPFTAGILSPSNLTNNYRRIHVYWHCWSNPRVIDFEWKSNKSRRIQRRNQATHRDVRWDRTNDVFPHDISRLTTGSSHGSRSKG
jgi:hypothetical protein